MTTTLPEASSAARTTEAVGSQVQRVVRPDGWYWVQKDPWHGEAPVWTPAEWRTKSRAWYSAGFGGIPDSGIVQHGPKIDEPGALLTAGLKA